jgi:SWI/SNF-related matrix-associated actin-dependent regulator of chromatin subfamily A-like protein 1
MFGGEEIFVRGSTRAVVDVEDVTEDVFAALTDALDAAEAKQQYGTFVVNLLLLPDGAHFKVHGRPHLPPDLIKALAAVAESSSTGGDRASAGELIFALKTHEAVTDIITPQFTALSNVNGIPPLVRQLAERIEARAKLEALACSETVVAVAIGRGLWDQLFSFQREGVLRAIRRGGRVLLADSMGMGKTICALSIAEYFRVPTPGGDGAPGGDCGDAAGAPDDGFGKSPVLILCPSTLRESWVGAVSKWLPNVPSSAVHCLSSSKDAKRLLKARSQCERDPWDRQVDVQFVICSYDVLPRLLLELGRAPTASLSDEVSAAPLDDASTACTLSYRPTAVPAELSIFGTVIADECHSLKNISTARARACVPVLLASEYRILVSGTPVTSHPAELYAQLQCLLGEGPQDLPFLPPTFFEDRYCGGYAASARGATNLSELNAILNMVMIRRSKAEAGLDLPPKLRSHSYLDITEDRVKRFNSMFADRRSLGDELAAAALSRTSANELGVLTSRLGALNRALFSATALAKIPGVLTRLRQLVVGSKNEHRKLLLFAHHRVVLDAVQDLCRRERVRFIRIDGSTPSSVRWPLVNLFQSDDSGIRVAVLSIQTAGTGLTLTKADYVLFAELDWVPSNLAQAEDRAHRIGRKGAVHIEYVVARKTLDDWLWPAVRRKLGKVGMIVDGVAGNEDVLDPERVGTTLAASGASVQATLLAAADGAACNAPVLPSSRSQRSEVSRDTPSSQDIVGRGKRIKLSPLLPTLGS